MLVGWVLKPVVVTEPETKTVDGLTGLNGVPCVRKIKAIATTITTIMTIRIFLKALDFFPTPTGVDAAATAGILTICFLKLDLNS
jgi:hypothetical protein